MPFIVGAPRSGTTLLRLMLDANSQMAIPPETGFIPALAAISQSDDMSLETFLETVTSFPPEASNWLDFGISQEAFRLELAFLSPFTPSEGIRCFYRTYAGRFAKPRYGDKTPAYCHSIPLIEQMLPEAAFIHVIRDGRDSCLSLRPMWFSPGPDMKVLADYWRKNVLAARAGHLVA